MKRHSYEIAPSTVRPGAWCYRVISPEGEEIAAGAREDTEQGVRKMLDKFIQRQLDGKMSARATKKTGQE